MGALCSKFRERTRATEETRDPAPDEISIGAGLFGCRLLRQLRRQALSKECCKLDMVMFGSFGQDLDNEKALCVAAALQRMGLLGKLSVVAHTGDAEMRARLAKGTLNALGAKHCRVAAGAGASCATTAGESAKSLEFAHADYMAPADELFEPGGHELFFDALQAAVSKDRKVCVVLTSVLTDMAAVVADPRWTSFRGAIASVTVSGGATLSGAGLRMEAEAGNNSPDLPAAESVYSALHKDKDLPFVVVTRHAAGACPICGNAFSGSLHPVARRLRLAAVPLLQSLWERVHRSEEERHAAGDHLPARCDAAWFRAAFLSDEAPRELGPRDPIQDYVARASESWCDGLATLAGLAYASESPGLGPLRDALAPHFEPETETRVLGLSEDAHGIVDPHGVGDLLRELMVTVAGGGDGALLRRAAEIGQSHQPVDLVLVGDYGKDLDDETSLLVVAAFKRLGLVGQVSAVANLGDAKMRARLAKGTLKALELGDCPVAAGSHGGRPDEELYEHEFAHCGYLAEPEELDPQGGHELIFAAIRHAASRRRQVCIILGSAMTDMAAVLRDPRWAAASSSVLCVAAMAGVKEAEAGELEIDITAANNAFDPEAARQVYDTLSASEGRPLFVVTTRFAAGACQMPRGALDGVTHPVGRRLVGVQRPALQKLWERTHRTQEEREKAKDALPMRCDAAWFRGTFLEERAPESLGSQDEIWQYVKGFNEYDALNLVAGIAAAYSPMLDEFFQCHRCPRTRTVAIGLDPKRHGIAKPARMSEMLHDCLIQAFEGRSKRGRKVEVLNDEGKWVVYLLFSQAREAGPDAWFAWDQSMTVPDTSEGDYLYLPPSEEGQAWRLAATQLLGDDEPRFVDPTHSYMYREVGGVQSLHILSDAAYRALRENFQTQDGDVMVAGVSRAGRTPVHVVSQALRGSKCLDSVDMSLPSSLEMAVSRGTLSAAKLNEDVREKMGPVRVFKTWQPSGQLPCRPGSGPLPSGLKVIYTVRDPRDVCLSQFKAAKMMCAADKEKFTWAGYVDLFCKGEQFTGWTGSWLPSTLDWWALHQKHPDQVLWVVFEDMLQEPQKTVQEVAAFLGVAVDDATVAHLAEAMQFDVLKKRYPKQLNLIVTDGVVGSHRLSELFSLEDDARFRDELVGPALQAGVRLAPEVRVPKSGDPSACRPLDLCSGVDI